VSALWLGFYAQWLTVVPVIMPDQITGIVGADNDAKEGIAGSIIAAGAAVALVVAPISGALSDRRRGQRGRRRPYLISGVIGTCVSLVLLALAAQSTSVWLYAAAILNLQFWWNWAAGPYAGLVPDVVPPPEQARASGWMNVMNIVGTILGSVMVLALYSPGRVLPLFAAFIVLTLALLAVTMRGVREPPARGAEDAFDLAAFARSFYLDVTTYRNLYWVLITRLLANMGIWSVLTFLLFYVESVVGLDRESAAALVPALLGAGAIVAIPASLLGVRFASRYGLVPLVRLTSWTMAAAAIGYVLVALSPDVIPVVFLVLIFSAAYGAYGAVDWALALKALPVTRDAGKDMGIWHISMVLPQILGPALTGWLITWLKTDGSAQLAYAVAFAIAALWFALAAAFVGRIQIAAR
jgi:Na+/melibiose symporter-like transporter